MYFYNGNLFVCSKNELKNRYQTVKDIPSSWYELNDEEKKKAMYDIQPLFLYEFDGEGTLVNTHELPLIEEGVIIYAHPLKNERYFILYQDFYRNTYLAFLESDGKIGQQVKFTEFISLCFVDEETTKYGDYRIHILITTANAYYYYNKNLTEYWISGDLYGDFIRCAEGCYIAGNTNAERVTANIMTGKIKSYPLRLPEEYSDTPLAHGADGSYYLVTQESIFRIKEDDQLETVLDRMDSGLNKCYAMPNYLRILDAETLFVRESTEKPLYLYKMTRIPYTEERARITLKYLDFASVNDWLAATVAQFNNQNEDYYVEIDFYGEKFTHSIGQEEDKLRLDTVLLSDDHPDIIVPMIGDTLTEHYDKGIFADLSEMLGAETALLGCIRNSYSYKGMLYQLPMMFTLDTYAAPKSTVDGYLTYETFFDILDGLSAGEVLADMAPTALYGNALMDFVDFDTGTANYDCEEFRDVLRYMTSLYEYCDTTAGGLSFGDVLYNGKWYSGEGKYWTMNGTVPAALESGKLKFLSVNFHNPEAYSAMKLLFDGTPFSLCGYPCTDGGGARINTSVPFAVMADTDVYEGCRQFLQFCLSDERQTDGALTDTALPVTLSAMEKELDSYRYTYYPNATAKAVHARNTSGYLDLSAAGHSAELLDTLDGASVAEHYTVVEMTAHERAQFLDFFENSRMRTNADPFIKEIIEEEVSFWKGNARTLEETTKIIQSRVWIYINE
ncbi:MAG: extracellular solute-binding protein [Clostridia bacterium]|nr:extracellular solute-binding protein [Clostridia bacterium]